MYLKNIAIKNIGPIDELSVALPFNANGNPKPVIFVGENGSGKTILQSQIIDGFYEVGGKLFNDIKKTEGLGYKYYKISGGINLQFGKDNGFSLLRFVNNKNESIEYFDKIHKVQKKDFKKLIHDFSLSPNNKKDNQKETTEINEERKVDLQNEWLAGAYFYQPAYRYEEPFWKNDFFADETRFEDNIRFSGQFNKQIEVVSSTKDNKSYLMDLVLDFANNPKNIVDISTWSNINNILRKIKQRDNIRFGIGPRGGYRVSIVEENQDGSLKQQLLPSIDNLSLGESLLLNLFINIIRHGDKPPKLTDQIQGIVAIDEIDVHLHTDLQNSVLPELISMFPKIQFIITTHSPLFLLGMKNQFGEDGFEVRNMPNGDIITTERFSEFENAYQVLKDTEKFEDDIKQQIVGKDKPIVYVEGPTDVQYIKKAYELYKKDCTSFDIQIIGKQTESGTEHSNNKELTIAERLFSTKLNLLSKKVLLLHDPGESAQENQYDSLLYIRQMTQFTENPLQKGIENLFNEDLIDKVQQQFPESFSYLMKGETKENFKIHVNKQPICDWICKNGTKDDFKNFEEIFDIIEDTICLEEQE